MKRTVSRGKSKGFALPTVMIASVVMLMVLLSGLVAASSVNASLRAQYQDRLLAQAKDSGTAMALACIAKNSTGWTDSLPLRPNTTCAGGAGCTNTATCFVLSGTNTRTSFSVGTPVLDTNGYYTFKVTATNESVRTSGTVAKTTTNQGSIIIKTGWDQIAPGYTHTCALSLGNKVYCWGLNGSGQLGNGTTTASYVPVAVSQGAIPAGAKIQSITTGSAFSCAIAFDGKAYCWGWNSSGRLGVSSGTTQSTVPIAVSQGAMPANTTLKEITSGMDYACALATTGLTYCWGNNPYGQIGNDTTATVYYSPVAVIQTDVSLTSLRTIDAGSNLICGISTNDIGYCWGFGTSGAIGNGGTVNRARPTAVAALPGGATVKKISAGANHACSIGSNAKAYCWGSSTYGQIGDTFTSARSSPTAVAGDIGLTTVSTITAGQETTCAITTDNKVYCWGDNSNGKVGNNSATANFVSPVDITSSGSFSGKTISSIASSGQFLCALDIAESPYCWGTNTNGQLGNGGVTEFRYPNPTRKVADAGFSF